MKCSYKKAFTLVELLVVISIISLLASVIMASLNSARGKARYARMISDMRQIAEAAQLDYDSRGDWAPDVGAGGAPAFVGVYLPSWPTPPCSDWVYDWDNWIGYYSDNPVRISSFHRGSGSGAAQRKFPAVEPPHP